MPKNCKGCVRYKLLTIYQYAQSLQNKDLGASAPKAFFFYLRSSGACSGNYARIGTESAEGFSSGVPIRSELIADLCSGHRKVRCLMSPNRGALHAFEPTSPGLDSPLRCGQSEPHQAPRMRCMLQQQALRSRRAKFATLERSQDLPTRRPCQSRSPLRLLHPSADPGSVLLPAPPGRPRPLRRKFEIPILYPSECVSPTNPNTGFRETHCTMNTSMLLVSRPTLTPMPEARGSRVV
jgi:hypothetical protein